MVKLQGSKPGENDFSRKSLVVALVFLNLRDDYEYIMVLWKYKHISTYIT